MMGKTAIKILTVTVPISLAVGWLLGAQFSGSGEAGFVVPLTDVQVNGQQTRAAADRGSDDQLVKSMFDASAATVPATPLLAERLGVEQSEDLQARFLSANGLLDTGRLDDAIAAYQALVKDYPTFVEPYVNLASALARSGELDQARLILKQSAQANQSTKVLFESINTLHGVIAAHAYRKALETEVPATINAQLPVVTSLATDFALEQQVASLKADIAQQMNQQASLAANENAAAEKVSELQMQVQRLEVQIDEQGRESKSELTALEAALRTEQEKVLLAKAELTKFKQQTEETGNDLIAKLRIELADKESQLAQFRNDNNHLIAKLDKLNQELASSVATTAQVADTTAPVITPSASVEGTSPQNPVDVSLAVSLVKAWALAWSAQDVDAYVDFYEDGYTPNGSLTHTQWLNQRRVRLGNKRFIKVKVDNFEVTPKANGFAVTFSQHYRSNTLDDTIVKRLTFAADGADLGQAKIVSEAIIRR